MERGFSRDRTLVDYECYSISSKGLVPAVVDIMAI